MSRDGADPRPPRSRLLGPELAAVLTAAAFELLFAIGFATARRSVLLPGYLVLAGVLTLAVAVVCALAGSLLSRRNGPRAGLVLYVLAHGAVNPISPWIVSPVVAGFGVVTWLALSAGSRLGLVGWGTAVGAAICAALQVWPYVGPALGLEAVSGWQSAFQSLAVFAFVLIAAQGWELLRARAEVLPSFVSVSMLALVVGLGATAIAVERLRPQSEEFPAAVGSASVRELPDVFVLVLDTVRADRLSSYGYERETTPNLTRFLASEPGAVRYDLAFSPASWTIPSHSSLLTGLMPSAHGAMAGTGENIAYSATESISLTADRTLAEVLRGAGYCTAGVVANAYLLRVEGLRRGFDVFFEPPATRRLRVIGEELRKQLFPGAFAGRIKPYPLAETVNEQVLRVHRECGERPAFVLANYMDAHSPYLAPKPHAGRFAGVDRKTVALPDAQLSDPAELVALKSDRYDESLHYLDAQLSRLIEALRTSGDLDDAWLFITADHGEAFVEHGTTSHGSSIYNEQVRVPLIMKPPRGVRVPPVSGSVSLLDVPATIAAIAGQRGFGAGFDLREVQPANRVVGIEFTGGFRRNVRELGETADDPARAALIGHWKLIERGRSYELYDLSRDPREQTALPREGAAIADALADALPAPGASRARVRIDARSIESLDPEERETLRALGYLR